MQIALTYQADHLESRLESMPMPFSSPAFLAVFPHVAQVVSEYILNLMKFANLALGLMQVS